jgi:sulfoxide reductase heme-binding subunit YedZ
LSSGVFNRVGNLRVRGRTQHWIAIFLAALPLVALALEFAIQGPGANPIEEITHVTGEWGLRLILISLAITPARQFFGLRKSASLRRTFGLAGFAYATLHLSTWALLDLGLDTGAIVEDLTERPYIMVGMAAFSLLTVLALTSTRAWMKRLGHRWVRLHRAVYVAAMLGVVHHFWLIKADYRPAIVHALILASLLGARLVWRARQTA